MDHDRGGGNSRYRYEEEEGRKHKTQKNTHVQYLYRVTLRREVTPFRNRNGCVICLKLL